MEIKKAIDVLKRHNAWRGGADMPMPEPRYIGEARPAIGALRGLEEEDRLMFQPQFSIRAQMSASSNMEDRAPRRNKTANAISPDVVNTAELTCAELVQFFAYLHKYSPAKACAVRTWAEDHDSWHGQRGLKKGRKG